MHSRFLALLFAFLLLGMQQEAQLHAITHIGDQLQRSQDQGMQVPAGDSACAACALFAGGTAAIPTDGAGIHEAPVGFAVLQGTTPSPAVSALTYYLSRAPPLLL